MSSFLLASMLRYSHEVNKLRAANILRMPRAQSSDSDTALPQLRHAELATPFCKREWQAVGVHLFRRLNVIYSFHSLQMINSFHFPLKIQAYC